MPYDPPAGNEASVEGFAELFPGVRSLAGVVAVIFLIFASLSALLSLFISVAIYYILTRITVRPATTDFYTTLRVIFYTSAALCKNLN